MADESADGGVLPAAHVLGGLGLRRDRRRAPRVELILVADLEEAQPFRDGGGRRAAATSPVRAWRSGSIACAPIVPFSLRTTHLRDVDGAEPEFAAISVPHSLARCATLLSRNFAVA